MSTRRPDVVLVNETGQCDVVRLSGYSSITSSLGAFSGVAILVSKKFPFIEIPCLDDNFLAVKILTSIGYVVFATVYSAPRIDNIQTISINKLLTLRLPVFIIGDMNAHHPSFHNTRNNRADDKGKQLYSIVKNKKLNHLGPYFTTYVTANRQGTPDIALSNNYCNVIHHHVYPGTTYPS